MTPYRLGHPLLTGPVSGRVMELKSELMSFLGSYMKSQNISTAGDERAKGLGGCTCCRRLLQLGGATHCPTPRTPGFRHAAAPHPRNRPAANLMEEPDEDAPKRKRGGKKRKGAE